MLNIVHLFNFQAGSRYPHMINQGLMNNSAVNLIINEPVISFGEVIKRPLGKAAIRQALLESDLIFRPSESHWGLPDWTDFLNRQKLWGKVVYYDFKDDLKIDEDMRRRCKLYVKRTWPPLRDRRPEKFLPLPYGVLDEYLFYDGLEIDKDINVLYIFDKDKRWNQNEVGRRNVYQILQKANLPGIHMGKQTTTNGRRAIFSKPQGNPFLEYLMLLKRSRIVIAIQPDHGGGDSRLWEAFAAGACVITNDLKGEFEPEFPYNAYAPFDPYDDKKSDTLVPMIENILSKRATAEMTAMSELSAWGKLAAINHHRSCHRVERILEYAV